MDYNTKTRKYFGKMLTISVEKKTNINSDSLTFFSADHALGKKIRKIIFILNLIIVLFFWNENLLY